MRTTSFFIALSALTLFSCNRHEEIYQQPNTLITPKIEFTESENPYTGLLDIYPSEDQSSIYFGNYRNDMLSPMNAYYIVAQGNITQSDPPLTLPAGNYHLVYWGISQAVSEAYDSPAVVEPPITLGVDIKQLSLSLRPNLNDTTFMPTFDYVFNARSTQIGDQGLSVPLRRVTAGLMVNIRRDNSTPLDASISSIDILVSNIADKLNLYDATPSDFDRTVKFELSISEDRMSASNKMVTVFPSNVRPVFTIVATLSNGQQKIYSTTLNNVLTAGSSINVNVEMGAIIVQQTSGNGFTVTHWNEQSETITTGPI